MVSINNSKNVEARFDQIDFAENATFVRLATKLKQLQKDGIFPEDIDLDVLVKYIKNFPDVAKKNGIDIGSLKDKDLVPMFYRLLELQDGQFADNLKEKLKDTQAQQEMEQVLAAIAFSTSNPRGALSALSSLIGSLNSASAKTLAGSMLGSIAQFAAEMAQIIAKQKGNNDFGKEIVAALSGSNNFDGYVPALQIAEEGSSKANDLASIKKQTDKGKKTVDASLKDTRYTIENSDNKTEIVKAVGREKALKEEKRGIASA